MRGDYFLPIAFRHDVLSAGLSETSLILSSPERFAFRRVMKNAIKRKLYRVETRKYAEKRALRFHFGDRIARIIREAQCPVLASVKSNRHLKDVCRRWFGELLCNSVVG